MAKFGANDADKYGASSSNFFQLKNDKDTAVVRFMYNTLDDVQGEAVHEVEIDGKRRYVSCIREYNQPIEDCPLCDAGMKQSAKLFVFLYDVDAKEVKVWERGKNFFSKLSSLCARYNPLVSTPFEIERNGKPGDTSTKYETFPLETDETTIEDLPDIPNISGTIFLEKSFDEMEEYLRTGSFPTAPGEAPARNPAADRANRRPSTPAPSTRRRPTAATKTDDDTPF